MFAFSFIYSLLPLFSGLFVLILGFLIWLKKPKETLSRLFLFYCLMIAIWLFGTFKMFNAGTDEAAIFWDRIIYVGVILIPIALYHFGLAYCKISSQRLFLVIGYLLAFFFMVVSQTDFFVRDLFRYSWGVHTRAQILHHPFLVYFFAYFISFFVNLFGYYRRSIGLPKQQAKLVLVGFAILDLIGPLAFLPAYGISVYPVVYLSALPFVLLLAYAAIRYNALDMRVISTEVFASLLIFVFLAELFFVRSAPELLLRSLGLLWVAALAMLFIRSVRKEINRREEIQRLALELKSANDKLTEMDHAKSDFLSIAAHQLRTPLSIVKGYVSMVLAGDYGKLGNKKIYEVLDNVYKSNEHLIFLADDFLNIARLESGRVQYNFQETDLVEVVKQIVTEFEGKAKEKGLKLEYVFKHGLPKLTLDPEKIHHVIYNFLDNAIKYTPKGAVRVDLSQEDNFVTCSVTDTGIGMSHLDQENMFQKFYRGKNVAGLEVTGTGLGLYVSRRFIEAQGGRIWVHSRGPGKGSVFGITLPIKKE